MPGAGDTSRGGDGCGDDAPENYNFKPVDPLQLHAVGSRGDGDKVDECRETVYPPGSLLTVPAKLDHWLAARSEPVRIQVIVLDDEAVPGVQSRMK